MTDDTDWTVLVPVEVLEGETVPDALIDLLTPLPVVVLGYHVLPEQTPPDQARMQFEERAQAKLDDLAESFRESGETAETRLVFTHDEEQTVDRVADEVGATAILAANPTGDVEELLVPLSGAVDVVRVGQFLAALLAGRDIGVTLFHVAEDEDEVAAGERLLEDAADAMVAGGVPDEAIAREVTVHDHTVEAIGTAATEYDTVVMGESAPSLRTFLFGEASERIADRSLGPVLVVRKDRGDDETAE